MTTGPEPGHQTAIDRAPPPGAVEGRGFFARLAGGGATTRDVGLLILRVAFGASLSLTHGRVKLLAPARFIDGLRTRGFPLPLFFGWAAILSEFAGGLLLAIGLLTRPAATLVLITLGVAAFDFHAADPFAKRELALAYGTVALALAIAGPGRYSVDSWLGSRRSRKGGREP
jgi:putative oxidoreductase